MIIEDFEHVPGVHCGSVAMADLLRWAGHELAEPMVFGLGSGLGFFYLESDIMSPSRQIMGRSVDLETNVAEVLGLEMREHRERDAEEAWQKVRERLDDGVPVMVQCDLSELPYWDSQTPFNGHRIVLAGYDETEGIAHVADTHFEEMQRLDLEALERARASDAPPSFGNEFAWWELVPGEIGDLGEAIRRAVARNAEAMEAETPEVGGLRGLASFRDAVTGWRELEDAAWAYRFGYEVVEKRGTGGAMFRNLYREFLSESVERVPEFGRHQLPVSMSRNADAWSTLATYMKAMAMFLETDGEEPGEDPNHHVESMAEAVFQFESTFWDRVDSLF